MSRVSSHAIPALFGLTVGSIVGGVVYGLVKVEWPAICSGLAVTCMLYYTIVHSCKRRTTESFNDSYGSHQVILTVHPVALTTPTSPVLLEEDPC
jgi:hypothetical protein